jgi:hypothetical protein
MHHGGLFGTAEVGGGTRVADWIDLATPFAVLVPLLWFTWLQRPRRRWCVVAMLGSMVYVQGHGIHLAANSISNAASSGGASSTSDTIHLWDEVIGHYLWFGGLAIVITACTASARGRSLDVPVVALVAGGAGCGLTWATNALEGGTAIASLAASLAAIVPASLRHRGLAPALAAAGTVAAIMLASYGIWHGGFPQPSSM